MGPVAIAKQIKKLLIEEENVVKQYIEHIAGLSENLTKHEEIRDMYHNWLESYHELRANHGMPSVREAIDLSAENESPNPDAFVKPFDALEALGSFRASIKSAFDELIQERKMPIPRVNVNFPPGSKTFEQGPEIIIDNKCESPILTAHEKMMNKCGPDTHPESVHDERLDTFTFSYPKFSADHEKPRIYPDMLIPETREQYAERKGKPFNELFDTDTKPEISMDFAKGDATTVIHEVNVVDHQPGLPANAIQVSPGSSYIIRSAEPVDYSMMLDEKETQPAPPAEPVPSGPAAMPTDGRTKKKFKDLPISEQNRRSKAIRNGIAKRKNEREFSPQQKEYVKNLFPANDKVIKRFGNDVMETGPIKRVKGEYSNQDRSTYGIAKALHNGEEIDPI